MLRIHPQLLLYERILFFDDSVIPVSVFRSEKKAEENCEDDGESDPEKNTAGEKL